MSGWVIIGFIGQAAFFMRFLVQWLASEKKGESFIPIYFWYLSLIGGVILLIYAIHIGDPVFTAGQSCGLLVYIRNLMLISKNNKKAVCNKGMA